MCMADENEMNLILAQALLKLQQDVEDIKKVQILYLQLLVIMSNFLKA